jgi:hypothetical protein
MYEKLMRKLTLIKNGSCTNQCKHETIHKIKHILKKNNPAKLTVHQREKLKTKLKTTTQKNDVRHRKTNKKYTSRNSPPYPANENCFKKMIGNDRTYYISTPNKNGICTWKKV